MGEATPKPIKIGVKEGGGPPPGYEWNVEILDQAFEEAIEFLDEDQYDHMAEQVRQLARQPDPNPQRYRGCSTD